MNRPSSHVLVVPSPGAQADAGAQVPASHVVVRCHRQLRGPYSGGGALLRDCVVPELLERHVGLVARRAIEIIALAPELADRVPSPPWTLTEHAEGLERTRYYAANRTRRLAHGVAELLADWAVACHPGGVVVEFTDVDQADPTDRELIAVLLRRSDPARLTLVITGDAAAADPVVGPALADCARRQPGRRAGQRSARPRRAPGTDLAQAFIDSDGTDADPALQQAYAALPPTERARRHTARAAELTARQEPTLLLGAVPYHAEHGADPAGAGVEAIYQAVIRCLQLGFYEAALQLARRGRRLTPAGQPRYGAFTHKIGACLAYLDRGPEALECFLELRRIDVDAEVHMGAAYMLSMLYTRHLPKASRNDNTALEWANTAIAIADHHPDTGQRVFRGAFMRNARALVELHLGHRADALALVEEAARRMDAAYGRSEHQLHRSVLKYNRGLVLAALGQHDQALAAFDDVIAADPEYADYYFERAGLRRAAGSPDGALDDYDQAIQLSPPFFEVHVNRADLLRELGDDDAALADLDYVLELEPDQVDALINRADILLAQGETARASVDIRHGLTVDPDHAHLLCAWGTLQAEAGDTDGAGASYAAALRADPGLAAAWANRAVLAYSLGRITAAVDDLDHAIDLAADPELRMNRAIALQDLGEHQRALADLEAVRAAAGPVSPADPELLYRRGVSRHATGDLAGARADWQAHLAGYGDAAPSPHLDEIRRQAAGLDLGVSAPAVLA